MQDLHRDLAAVLRIVGEIDRRHPTSTHFASEAVPSAEERRRLGERLVEEGRVRDGGGPNEYSVSEVARREQGADLRQERPVVAACVHEEGFALFRFELERGIQ